MDSWLAPSVSSPHPCLDTKTWDFCLDSTPSSGPPKLSWARPQPVSWVLCCCQGEPSFELKLTWDGCLGKKSCLKTIHASEGPVFWLPSVGLLSRWLGWPSFSIQCLLRLVTSVSLRRRLAVYGSLIVTVASRALVGAWGWRLAQLLLGHFGCAF